MTKLIGFLINPIAGMGGTVGLKGTDGLAKKAQKLGAKPQAQKRTYHFLKTLSSLNSNTFPQKQEKEPGFCFLTCEGPMGGHLLNEFNFPYRIIYSPPNNLEKTKANDTKIACREFLNEDVDLILFCGGDGTARDIYSALVSYEMGGKKPNHYKPVVPLLGIPAGVKMHSSLFAVNPASTAQLFQSFIKNKTDLVEAEIMDIDEEKFRQNELQVKLWGYVSVPYQPTLIQSRKIVHHSQKEEEAKENIATFLAEIMQDDSVYILGPGTTVKKINQHLNLDKTLLGVDVVQNQELIAKDANEQKLLNLLEDFDSQKIYIVLSPIGKQGFVLGRGNQQISPRVLKKIGKEKLNFIIVATPQKLSQIPHLLVDTRDPKIDRELTGTHQIICDYRLAQRKKIDAPCE